MTAMRDYSEQDWRREIDRIDRDNRNADVVMFLIGMGWTVLCLWLAFSA